MYEAREKIFKKCRECTSFKVSLATEIYKLFECKIAFDPFGGWGDRMIGAAAAGVTKYVCVDANKSLDKGYQDIRTFLGTVSNMKIYYNLMQTENYGVEDFKKDFVNEAPDLIFTSPPFHDFEQYSNHEDSCKYTKFEDWIKWMFQILDRCWGMLRPDGHIALYLSSINCDIAKRIKTFMESRGRKFCGVISCSTRYKRPLPLFVWKKTSNEKIHRESRNP